MDATHPVPNTELSSRFELFPMCLTAKFHWLPFEHLPIPAANKKGNSVEISFRSSDGQIHPVLNFNHHPGNQNYTTIHSFGGRTERIPTRKDPDIVTFTLLPGVLNDFDDGCSLVTPKGHIQLHLKSMEATAQGTLVTAFLA